MTTFDLFSTHLRPSRSISLVAIPVAAGGFITVLFFSWHLPIYGLYALPVILSLWIKSTWATIGTALIANALILIHYVYVLSDPMSAGWTDAHELTELLSALMGVWFIAFVGLYGKRAALLLQEKKLMEQAIQERTDQLSKTNVALEAEKTQHERSAQQLRELLDLQQLQIRRLPIGVIVWDPNFCVEEWNPSAEEIFGYTKEEAMGKHAYDLILTKASQPAVDKLWDQFTAGGDDVSSINENVTKGGRSILCQWWNTRLASSGPGSTSILSTVKDITSEEQTRKVVQKSEARLAEAQRLAHLGNWTFYADTQTFDWSDEMYRIHGLRPRELTPTLEMASSYIHPDDYQQYVKAFEDAVLNGDPDIETDCRIVRADNTDRFVHVMGTVAMGPDGQVTEAFGTMQDVTEFEAAKESLIGSEATNRALLEAIPDMIFQVNVDGTYLGFKPGKDVEPFAPPESFLGKKVAEVLPPETADGLMRHIKQASETGEVQTVEYQLVQSGEVRNFESQFAPSKVNEVLVIARDTTERNRLQQQLLQTDKLAAIGTLVSGVAHEVNNPLTGVLGITELLLRGDLDEAVRQDLTLVYDEAAKAVRIMQSLLSFAREGQVQKTDLSVNELVKSTLALRDYELKKRHIAVHQSLTPDLPTVSGDSNQIQQVLMNLVINAEQAIVEAHGSGTITVETRERDHTVEVVVSDDGPGIPPEIIDRIFDPFFSTKPTGQGTGLGLSISHGIMRRHRGTLTATNGKDAGAEFHLTLPVGQVDAVPEPVNTEEAMIVEEVVA